jgi:predicted DNA-binding transcriptional regulator YafY
MMALLDGRELRVRYLSVSSGSDGWRDWVPGGLGWDGRRWHVRAWCGMRGEWRDFVLGRVVAAEWPGRQVAGLPEDSAWREEVRVRLRVNPELDEKQREALSLDYGLVDERMELRVRRAMLPYLLADLFIEPQGHRALARHFVVEE